MKVCQALNLHHAIESLARIDQSVKSDLPITSLRS